MHVHPSLPVDVLDRWSIDPGRRVAPFRHEQAAFLAHHRELFASKVGGTMTLATDVKSKSVTAMR